MATTHERSRTARDFADRMGWVPDTVYVNLRRSRKKLALGKPLDETDLPLGVATPGGLRWTTEELERFVAARKRSRRRGGRPRLPSPLPSDAQLLKRRRDAEKAGGA